MFWNRFIELCNQRDTTPTAVVRTLGISVGSVTRWKNGSIPNDTTLRKLADFFGVECKYFSCDQDTSSDDELAQYLEELRSRPEMKMLFSLAKRATKEDVERAVAIIEALRESGHE